MKIWEFNGKLIFLDKEMYRKKIQNISAGVINSFFCKYN